PLRTRRPEPPSPSQGGRRAIRRIATPGAFNTWGTTDHMPEAPKPFSSEWMNAPEPEPEQQRRIRKDSNARVIRFFSKFPGERSLTFLVVLVLVLGSFWFAGPGSEAHRSTSPDLVAEVPETPQI